MEGSEKINPQLRGFSGLPWTVLDGYMVGHEGFEPSTPTSRT
jgi:hypothetical protein